MSAGSIDYGALGIEKHRTSTSVLVDRPDKRMMSVRYLAPFLILCIGAIIYSLPIGDLKVVFLPLTWLFAIALVYAVTMHEILARAVYTVTAEYIESVSGIVAKKVRTIPMSYVRDVTYGQNIVQALLRVSDITVSSANGDKIVLKDIADGYRKRDVISKMILSKSPNTSERT